MMRQLLWLALVALCGCVPVVASYYQPVGPGEIKPYNAACSMTILVRMIQHLPAKVDVEVNALAKTPGIAHPSIAISIDVPSGTTVRFTESTIKVQAGSSAPAILLTMGRIRKPRMVANRGVSDYLEPGDPLGGPYGYGISVQLPAEMDKQNPAELIVTLPALDINGQRVEVAPMRFILKRRAHVTGFC